MVPESRRGLRAGAELRGVKSGERRNESGGTENRRGKALRPVGRRCRDKGLFFRRMSHGAGRGRYPGDVGDEAARSLLVAADLHRLKVVCRAVAGSIACRQRLVKSERKNLKEKDSQQKTADKGSCR
jgi:hypothetical protein